MMLQQLLSQFGTACQGGSFLFFPTWYAYLPGATDTNGTCVPQVTSLSDVWLIVAAIIEILLRLAALVAFGFVVYAGFLYLTSQGEPEKIVQARTALIDALVGLVIAVMAATIVGFIAGSIS